MAQTLQRDEEAAEEQINAAHVAAKASGELATLLSYAAAAGNVWSNVIKSQVAGITPGSASSFMNLTLVRFLPARRDPMRRWTTCEQVWPKVKPRCSKMRLLSCCSL